ncbi:addiction module antitoxin [Desulfonatronovibrio magnus]|uniref:addiction module antitoxin n=1 Tax=Desulfonatronovibrio magnus TaxID=698827 RepID=UPI0005EB58E9|nr:addiction module antitoxin [Desulfonatronovibrio magnus]
MPEVSFTFEFKRNLRALAKKYRSIKADLQPLIDSLEDGELPGDQIPGVHLAIFKVRIQNTDIQKGKRSGYRCIYYLKTRDQIILVTIYSKLDQSDVSGKRIKEILSEMS